MRVERPTIAGDQLGLDLVSGEVVVDDGELARQDGIRDLAGFLQALHLGKGLAVRVVLLVLGLELRVGRVVLGLACGAGLPVGSPVLDQQGPDHGDVALQEGLELLLGGVQGGPRGAGDPGAGQDGEQAHEQKSTAWHGDLLGSRMCEEKPWVHFVEVRSLLGGRFRAHGRPWFPRNAPGARVRTCTLQVLPRVARQDLEHWRRIVRLQEARPGQVMQSRQAGTAAPRGPPAPAETSSRDVKKKT